MFFFSPTNIFLHDRTSKLTVDLNPFLYISGVHNSVIDKGHFVNEYGRTDMRVNK